MSLRRLATALVAILAGCTAGPDYRRPSAPVPAAYKEAAAQSGFKLGTPADAAERGAWWSVYRDPVLDRLERQVEVSNQTLKADLAAFRQAEALVAAARAGFFPTVDLNASASRSRGGGGGGGSGAASGGRGGGIGNFYSATGSASWVPDLWGKIARTVESSVATAQASAGTLAAARLAAQGQLATAYVQLRSADELKRLLDESARAFAESARITRNQYQAGTASAADVAQAEAQLRNTEAQAIAVGVSRAQLEHAIAVLIGRPPAELTIPPTEAALDIPAIPPGLPSALLERRPDIAAAERNMAAANAQIGVAEAAFYPDITLSADYGGAATRLAKLLSASNRIWSFGSDLVETIFDGGARNAQLDAARAAFDREVATYRQTVLTAFQQVEDQLAALRILAEQAKASEAALKAAREAERIITNQYRAGTVAYTAVIVAQTTALGDAVTLVNLRQSRLVASVALIEALGGGWDASQLPGREQIERDNPLNFSPLPSPPKAQSLSPAT
jgi:NodT family efflux transporter outer membrane factor (OMF) lipoprotein